MGKNIEYAEGCIIGNCQYIKDAGKRFKERAAEFKCKCGNIFVAAINKVKRGQTMSCGCMKPFQHGYSRKGNVSSEYSSWHSIKDRCYNPNIESFPNYGGRGIEMCDRWKNSFSLFLEDMGKKPSRRYSIERIDNNGNYEPGNCKWDIMANQTKNRRSNVFIEYEGERFCLADWARKLKVDIGFLSKKIKQGKSIKDIIPFNESKRKIRA